MSTTGQGHYLTLAKRHSDFKIKSCFWFKHIYFVLQLYKHINIYVNNTSYEIRREAKSL